MLLVSIITISYNTGRFIEDNILSVKYQDYPHIEHIIIDGGSTDSTVAILHKHNNLRWLSEPDEGITDAINKGISMASGDILAFQNSDDAYYARDAVRKAVDAMKANPAAGAIFGDCAVIDADGKVKGFFRGQGRRLNFSAMLCSEFIIPLPSAFIRRAAIDAIGGKLDTSLNLVPDWELWARIGLKFPIMYLAETFGSFREYQEQTSASIRCAFESASHKRIILDRIFRNPELPTEIRALQNRAYAGTYAYEAYMLLNVNQRGMARKCVWTAFRLYPRNLLNRELYVYLLRSVHLGKLISLASAIKYTFFKKMAHPSENQTIRWWLG